MEPPASQAGLGTSSITGLAPADNGASSGPQTGESSADVDAPDVPMQADGDQSGADVAGSP